MLWAWLREMRLAWICRTLVVRKMFAILGWILALVVALAILSVQYVALVSGQL